MVGLFAVLIMFQFQTEEKVCFGLNIMRDQFIDRLTILLEGVFW